MDNHREVALRNKLAKSLDIVEQVLDTNRKPKLAGEVHHKYVDKFTLASFMTNSAIAAVLTSLKGLGLEQEKLSSLIDSSKDLKTVTLQFNVIERCEFVKKDTRKVDSVKVNKKKNKDRETSEENITVTHETDEYHWKFSSEWSIKAYSGTNQNEAIILRKEDGSTEIQTPVETPPFPNVSDLPPVTVSLEWLLKHLSSDNVVSSFKISREKENCFTPRRNEDIDEALEYFSKLSAWCQNVARHLRRLFNIHPSPVINIDTLQQVDDILVPILPLIEEINTHLAIEDTSPKTSELKLWPFDNFTEFLEEQNRGISARSDKIKTLLPASDSQELITSGGGITLMLISHLLAIIDFYTTGVDYLELMLSQQLAAAIGKEITPSDFSEYMRYHMRRSFEEERAFSFAVRREGHDPEGVISIEQDNQPISCLTRHEPNTQMKFALNASSNVNFSGDTYIHMHVLHRFSSQRQAKLDLRAQARQFSGFILLLGKIGGADLFLPEAAVLVTNKDEFSIPLDLEEIPSAKEFADAIESLSPEQQAFAKSFRQMKLSSTLFGLCVIQIKPQLERVLNLKPESLAKEIKLTKDLLQLFVEYSIPSDILSFQPELFEDESDVDIKERLKQVKAHVAGVFEVIQEEKELVVKEAELLKKASPEFLKRASPEPMMAPACFSSYMAPKQMKATPYRGDDVSFFGCNAVVEHTSSPDEAPVERPYAEDSSVHEDIPLISDLSRLPHLLDKNLKEADDIDCLRPTVITPGDTWKKHYRKNILSSLTETKSLKKDCQKKEKDKVFDLLDSLSRSGALQIQDSTLHVFLAATHVFDTTLVNTVIQRNQNPIEKLDKSLRIVKSTVFEERPFEY